MEYTTLGDTGMRVSRICLGCMSWGRTDWRPWVLDEEGGLELIERALDLGINFFDTSNMYSWGESERILGRGLEGHHDETVVATKCYFQVDEDNPNSGGLSRKAIEQELDKSLERLRMDTVDLYQIHRWDYQTPIEQTMRALDDAVRRGKVRYLGATTTWAHLFAEALHTSDRLGLDRFLTLQDHYNLVYREEEREMLPLCDRKNVATMSWSPLARGYLTRPHDETDATHRGSVDKYMFDWPYREGGGPEINARVEELAAEKGVTMAQIALAWLFQNDWVTVPILGTTSVDHLEEAVEALDVKLSSSDVEYLEEPYQPVPITGHE
ncbi:MAG: aldo/keto reductase [Halobacteriota archaeon]